MSAVVDFIEDVVDAIVGVVEAVIDIITEIVETIWEVILEPILEFVVGLFGIKAEDIISTEVTVKRIIEEDERLADTIVKVCLERQKDPSLGIMERVLAYASLARARYNTMYRYGKDHYVHGLPECNLKAMVLDNTKIKQCIDTQYGISSTVLTSKISSPDKYEYVGYVLHNSHGYTPSLNTLTYNSDTYKVVNIDYNYTYDRYDVYISSYEDRTTTITTTTTVTVTPVNETTTTTTTTTTVITVTSVDVTTDNKHTVVTQSIVTVGEVTGVIEDTISLISDVNEVVPKGTAESSTVSDVVITVGELQYADEVRAIVTQRTVLIGTKSGTINDTAITLSDVVEEVPIGTTVPSIVVQVASSPELDVVYANAVLQVVAFLPKRYYVVKYENGAPGQWYWWVYLEGSGVWPILDSTNYYVTGLEMLPIVTIRNGTINVNSNKASEEYLQAKQMLEFINMDIDVLTDSLMENDQIANVEDAFVHFGLNPKDTSKVVSKTLFIMFDYSFSDLGIVTGNQGYVATYREGPFNAALGWKTQTREVKAGIIGSLGSYKHSISGTTLILQKQEEPEYYVEIVLGNMSTVTFVDREGLFGTKAIDLGMDSFFIPISNFFIGKLSPLEQQELFNKTLIISIYAASVQHLEWYETEAFGKLLQVIGIIVFIFTWNPASFSLSTALMTTAVMLGASMLLKMIMEATDSPFLRMLAGVAFVAISMWAGNGFDTGVFTSALDLTMSVSQWATAVGGVGTAISAAAAADMSKLQGEWQVWAQKVETKQAEIDEVKQSMLDDISTFEVAQLARMQVKPAYLEGVDLMMYRARDMQYNYNALYDYNKLTTNYVSNQLRLGII